MTVLYGESNVGKTFVSLKFAYCVATGKPFQNRQVEKGAVWIGTPERLTESIRSYHDEIGGFDDASMQINFHDMAYEDAEQSVKLFGEKVIPAFA